jgi:pSer/pThr/pTyr-binding forkhead associated (FHA) protein
VPETPVTIPGEIRAAMSAAPRRVLRTYALVVGGATIPLDQGIVTLGRSSRCDVILESPEVSRQHARLVVSNIGVAIEDVESRNGVYVNGERVRAARAIEEGDRIVIGDVELLLKATHRVSAVQPSVRKPTPPPRRAETPPPSTLPGRRTDAFNELARLSDRMLSMGRPEVAMKLVSERLQSLLEALRNGEKMSVRMLETATSQALRLAVGDGGAKYADLALELNLLARRPMNDEGIVLLERALQQLPEIDSGLLLSYQKVLHSGREGFGPFERIRADRLMALRASD